MSKEELYLNWLKSVLELKGNTIVVKKLYDEKAVLNVIKEWLEDGKKKY